MFEIENYKMPCYFIGLKHLPFRYENQKNLDEFTQSLHLKKRRLLVVGNYVARAAINDLKLKNLVFLRTNTTS